MDACEIANFLATELFMQQLVSLDGIQSGVPTLTTSTLTPTTLRNIEQTFIELTSDPPASIPYQAGFVPPIAPYNAVDTNDNNSMCSSESGSQSSWHTPILHEENSMAMTDTSSVATIINSNGSPSLPTATITASAATTTTNATGADVGSSSIAKSTPSRKNVGGRRPNKPSNLSPEEEEKRKIRRERNKLAAARCRKRRVDQTNELIEKVDQLEKEKQGLQKKIEDLQYLKEDLQMCLESHRTHCRLHDPRAPSPLDTKPVIISDNFDSKSIKSEPLDPIVDSLDGPPSPKRIMLTANNPVLIPPLPNVSTISSTIASANSLLNTPTITTSPPPSSLLGVGVSTNLGSITKPNRPSSLNVPLTMTPSQSLALGKNISEISGVPISTPSSGVMFNFDSLMDGGTGLTPVSAPLMPTCSSQNKHPLELTTPTSEPSKLVSL